MGAHNFADYVEGIDVEQTYRQAVEDAEYEYGHSGYNGTISTTNGVEVVQATPVTLEQAHELANRLLDRFEKRGPAGAIAVKTNRRTITADIPETPDGRGWRDIAQAVEEALRGKLREGEQRVGQLTGMWKTSEPVYRGYGRPTIPPRVYSGTITTEVEGGEPQHTGWLFFGMAAS